MLDDGKHDVFRAAEEMLAEAKATGEALQKWTYEQQQKPAVAERQETLAQHLHETALYGSWTAFQTARSGLI